MKKLFLFALALFAAQLSQAQWEPDFRLTSDTNASTLCWSTQHAIAVCGDTIHVVWNDECNSHPEVYYKRSLDGGLTWESDVRLTNQADIVMYPSVAASRSIVQVAWMVGTNVGPPWYIELFYIRSPDGGSSWGKITQMTYNFGETYMPCMAVSDSVTHLVYDDYHFNWGEIMYKRSTDMGLTWESDVRLTVDPAWSVTPSVCAVDSIVHVAWRDERDNDKLEIYYKRSTDWGITWGEDTRLSFDSLVSTRPSIAASGSNVYLVWQDHRDQNAEIYFMKSTDNGLTWGENIRLTNDPNQSWFPNLAVSEDHLFVFWEETRDGNREIYYKCSYDSGDTWGPDTRLTEDAAGSYRPFIAVSGSQLNVMWYDSRDGNYEIYYKRDPTGNLVVGIDDMAIVKSEKCITVFPNPARRQLTVGSRQLAVRITIVDLYGREMKEFGDISSFPYQADISELRPGIYLLKVYNKKGIIGIVKFTKSSAP
ncbi:MAG: exo-alpha-sialidase [Bacteroidales bacterium]|nr:exo-alpha-sialidase [Bacteroidales bacterium]